MEGTREQKSWWISVRESGLGTALHGRGFREHIQGGSSGSEPDKKWNLDWQIEVSVLYQLP